MLRWVLIYKMILHHSFTYNRRLLNIIKLLLIISVVSDQIVTLDCLYQIDQRALTSITYDDNLGQRNFASLNKLFSKAI